MVWSGPAPIATPVFAITISIVSDVGGHEFGAGGIYAISQLKTYCPPDNPVTSVVGLFASVNTAVVGPDTCVHVPISSASKGTPSLALRLAIVVVPDVKQISVPASATVGESSAKVSMIKVSVSAAPQSGNPDPSSTIQDIIYSLPLATVASGITNPVAIAFGSFTSEKDTLGSAALHVPT